MGQNVNKIFGPLIYQNTHGQQEELTHTYIQKNNTLTQPSVDVIVDMYVWILCAHSWR